MAFLWYNAPQAALLLVLFRRHVCIGSTYISFQRYEKVFKEQRTFPEGLKEIEHLYDVGRRQVKRWGMEQVGLDSVRCETPTRTCL